MMAGLALIRRHPHGVVHSTSANASAVVPENCGPRLALAVMELVLKQSVQMAARADKKHAGQVLWTRNETLTAQFEDA